MKKIILLFVLIFFAFYVSAEVLQTPHTVEVITARGEAVFPVSFFNSEDAQTYSAVLEGNSPAIQLATSSVYVEKEEFGSFNLIIGNKDLPKGVYFDNLIISKDDELFQNIPIIIGIESRSSQIEYDVSIEFDPSSDISIISGETIVSPNINIYKLNYNNAGSNVVALTFEVYSIYGELLSSSEEVVSVSTQASFEHFFNLGASPLNEVLLVASAKKGDSWGLDVSQVSLSNKPLLSPVDGRDYSSKIYIIVFIFLLCSIILVSYLWYNRSNEQAKNWKGRLNYIKKTEFSDARKGLRKLKDQKDVLLRAYTNHYISKSSFDSATREITRLSSQLKKRL